MRLLSLILIPLIFVLAFFTAYTPVEATCQITAFPSSIAPGATINITISGQPADSGQPPGIYAAWLYNKSTESFVDIGSPSGAADSSGVATISFQAPTTTGDYTIGVNETIIGNPRTICTGGG